MPHRQLGTTADAPWEAVGGIVGGERILVPVSWADAAIRSTSQKFGDCIAALLGWAGRVC